MLETLSVRPRVCQQIRSGPVGRCGRRVRRGPRDPRVCDPRHPTPRPDPARAQSSSSRASASRWRKAASVCPSRTVFYSHGDEHDHEAHGDESDDDQIEIDLASQRRVARLDIGVRNIEINLIQGVRTGFFVIDVQDDHVDTRNGVESVDTRFDNRTCITRTLFHQRQQEHLTGRFGSELRFRNFAATGAEALSPRTQQFSRSAFGYEELTFGRYRLQVGGRLERTDYDAAVRQDRIFREETETGNYSLKFFWSIRMRAAIVIWLAVVAGCGGGSVDAPLRPAAEETPLRLVNDDWSIVEMATAHGAFTIEVEVTDGVDTAALARSLIQPLQDRYAEVLVYFHARDSETDLPLLRVQWTAAAGYAETRYR